MERKIFWATFTVLGLVADVVFPLWWALAATIPIVYHRDRPRWSAMYPLQFVKPGRPIQ